MQILRNELKYKYISFKKLLFYLKKYVAEKKLFKVNNIKDIIFSLSV